MEAPVIAALITAIASLVISLLNWAAKLWSDQELAKAQAENQKELARLSDSLTRDRDESSAQREYRFGALQRLYEEFQPLLFQLAEQSEVAYERVLLLAKMAKRGSLGPNQASWLADKWGYFSLTTTYRLLAPLVVFRLMQLRLTLVDLSLDPEIWTRYRMAKLLYVSLTNGGGLAESSPQIKYDQTKGLQHLRSADLDRLIELMTVERADGSSYCMSYGQWADNVEGNREDFRKLVEKVTDLFHDFHPDSKPVFWRVLLAQAHIHKAMMLTVQGATGTKSPPDAIPAESQREFDWREPTSSMPDAQVVTDMFTAVRSYLNDRMVVPGRFL
jgi:hypothetical protein